MDINKVTSFQTHTVYLYTLYALQISNQVIFHAEMEEPLDHEHTQIAMRGVSKSAANNSSLIKEASHNFLEIGVSLGAVIGSLTLILLFVMLGWIWLYCKYKKHDR